MKKNNGYRKPDNRMNTGGDKRDRTADLLHAMQALSQLSYTPNFDANYISRRRHHSLELYTDF